MFLVCTTASSENIVSLFADFEHLHIATENDACMVKPNAKALTAYATEHNFFLPVLGRADDEMKVGVVMKGAGIMFQPRHAMIKTDRYRYFLDGIKEPVTMLSIEGSSYVCFSADATHSGTAEFLLSEETKALFGAVYEAYMMYDAVLDNDWMDNIIDEDAYEYMTYKREAIAEAFAAE